MIRYVKTPDEVLDYGWDWSRLLPDGVTLAGVVHTVPTGLTLDAESYDDDGTTVWLSGGTASERYLVTAKATDSGGRIYTRTFEIVCRDYRSGDA